MKIRRRRGPAAAIGSARRWRNAVTHIGLRLAGLILLIVALATGRASGAMFWIALGVAVWTFLMLVLLVAAFVMVVRKADRPEPDQTNE